MTASSSLRATGTVEQYIYCSQGVCPYKDLIGSCWVRTDKCTTNANCTAATTTTTRFAVPEQKQLSNGRPSQCNQEGAIRASNKQPKRIRKPDGSRARDLPRVVVTTAVLLQQPAEPRWCICRCLADQCRGKAVQQGGHKFRSKP